MKITAAENRRSERERERRSEETRGRFFINKYTDGWRQRYGKEKYRESYGEKERENIELDLDIDTERGGARWRGRGNDRKTETEI